MKIELSKQDIEAAVQAHVADLGLPVEGKFVTIEFSTKRVGGSGLVAVVNIDDNAPVGGEVAPREVKPRKPRGPNKAKATTEGTPGTVGAAIATQGATTDNKTNALNDAAALAAADKPVVVTEDPVPVVANNPTPAATVAEAAPVNQGTTTSLFN